MNSNLMFEGIISNFRQQFEDIKAKYARPEPEQRAEGIVNKMVEANKPDVQIMGLPKSEAKVEVFDKPEDVPAPIVMPKNTGNMNSIMVTRQVGEDKVDIEIDANNVGSLTTAYLVRPEKKIEYDIQRPTIGNIDLKTYATRPEHEAEVQEIYNDPSPRVDMKLVKDFDYTDMQREFAGLNSPLKDISGQIAEALEYYGITPGEFVAVVRKDSGAGNKGPGDRAYDNKNPGNVGNVDAGGDIKFDTWIEGSVAAIRNLAERKVD